jgi:uncharacterized repeat protein (TIGR03847 family)
VAFQRYEFDEAERAEAEAIGVPGQRRFRLIFANQLDTVVLWLEKQQLQALGLAFSSILSQLREAGMRNAREAEQVPPAGPVPPSAGELQVGRMAVGFDEERRMVALFIHDIESGEDDLPNFICRLDLRQIGLLATQIGTVVAAGRPICPRCHQPMDPSGHVCPHDNGHFPHLIQRPPE